MFTSCYSGPRSTQQERCNTLWVHAHGWRHAVDLWKQELIIMLVRLALIRNDTGSHTNTIEANIVAVSRVCTIANVSLLCTRLKYLNNDWVWRYSWSPNDEFYDSADRQFLPLTPSSNHQNLKNTLTYDWILAKWHSHQPQLQCLTWGLTLPDCLGQVKSD